MCFSHESSVSDLTALIDEERHLLGVADRDLPVQLPRSPLDPPHLDHHAIVAIKRPFTILASAGPAS